MFFSKSATDAIVPDNEFSMVELIRVENVRIKRPTGVLLRSFYKYYNKEEKNHLTRGNRKKMTSLS